MSKESYARGFCKAAAAAGVDPVKLIKYAKWYNPFTWFGGSSEKKVDSSHDVSSINKSVDALKDFSDWAKRQRDVNIDTSSPDTISADDILRSAERVGWTQGGTTSTPPPSAGYIPPRVVRAPQTDEWSRFERALAAKRMGTPASAVTKSVAGRAGGVAGLRR